MIESPGHPGARDPLAPRGAAAARDPEPPVRVALAHDWLCGYRGGEAVLEQIAALLERSVWAGGPDGPRASRRRPEAAGLYAMFDDGRPISPAVDRLRARGLIRATRLGTSPRGLRARRWLLPAYPRLVGQLSDRLAADHARAPIDLLISTSSAAIKGLRPPRGVPHLCYCHSPARYVWSQRGQYAGGGWRGVLRQVGLAAYAPRFRAWDRATAANVTRFLANSTHTAREVDRCYGRTAGVVFPPVRTEFFTPDPGVPREGFWLVVSALEPYKRVDLAVEAAAAAGARLVVAGAGSQRTHLERLARGRAEFLGRVSDGALRDLYRRARLLLFPQVEDFGIVAAEALACGTPVVARRAGGAIDIVADGVTGACFDEPAAGAIAAAAARAPRDSAACRAAAERFGPARFDAEMLVQIEAALGARRPAAPADKGARRAPTA